MADRPDPARLLEELADSLESQKAGILSGDLEAAQEHVDKCDTVLASLVSCGPLTPGLARRLKEVAKLHEQVRLALAAARQSAADQLAAMNRGRTGLRAYRSQ